MPYVTATPVGKPSKTTRPARSRERDDHRARAPLPGCAWSVPLSWPSMRSSAASSSSREPWRSRRTTGPKCSSSSSGSWHGGRRVGGRLVAEAGPGRRRLGQPPASAGCASRRSTAAWQRVAQALVEQDRRRHASSRRAEVGGERVARLAGGHEHDAGLRAQLAAEAETDAARPFGDRVARAASASSVITIGLIAAHLGVDRDRRSGGRRGRRSPCRR